MLNEAGLRDVARLGIELSAEKDKNRLFEKLLDAAMANTGCDGGTLYLLREGKLHFKVMKTLSLSLSRGAQGEEIDLPPVGLSEKNVCAFAAMRRELVNIPDVYDSSRFDFSGPLEYDALTRYRTGSMLVVPLEDGEGALIGVLQLINKLDARGKIIPFVQEDEFLLQTLGSMTAVSLANLLYVNEIKAQMFSFVRAFAAAVDERTPYNGSHTRKVTVYAALLADEINRRRARGETEDFFDQARREQLILAAALHDIGKMVVPRKIMNKPTRLGSALETVRQRFRLLELCLERDVLAGRLSQEEGAHAREALAADLKLIEEKNLLEYLSAEDVAQVEAVAQRRYTAPDGTQTSLLTDGELRCLQIRQGTLTEEEIEIMRSHVVMTDRILSKVRFSPKYAQARRFAAEHHEQLNGRGYPRGLRGEEIPLESRILAVVDVFDALTCTDRPYKKPVPRPAAFAILHEKARNGEIEERLVRYLETVLASVGPEEIARMAQEENWGPDAFPPAHPLSQGGCIS